METDAKALDHAYHRSRVDAHIGGSIGFILLMVALAFLVGDKFEPFQEGADMWSPTLLAWRPDTNAWIPAYPNLRYELGDEWAAPPRVRGGSEPGAKPPRSPTTAEAEWAKPGQNLARTVAGFERRAGERKLPLITKEIYPRSYSVVVVLGSLVGAFFLYSCARRQTYLMLSVYGEKDENRPYDRPWEEVRITFWALFLVLLGVLFIFMI